MHTLGLLLPRIQGKTTAITALFRVIFRKSNHACFIVIYEKVLRIRHTPRADTQQAPNTFTYIAVQVRGLLN